MKSELPGYFPAAKQKKPGLWPGREVPAGAERRQGVVRALAGLGGAAGGGDRLAGARGGRPRRVGRPGLAAGQGDAGQAQGGLVAAAVAGGVYPRLSGKGGGGDE